MPRAAYVLFLHTHGSSAMHNKRWWCSTADPYMQALLGFGV